MANPINPKLKLFKFPTLIEKPNPSFGYNKSPQPPVSAGYAHTRWRDYKSEHYVTPRRRTYSYIIAESMTVALEFLRRRKVDGEEFPQYVKGKRLRQNKLSPTYFLSGRMRSMMHRNGYTNGDLGGNSWSIRDLALPFCQMVVLQGLVSSEEMFHPSGWYINIGLYGNYTHKLVEQVEAWEKLIPGMTPDYAFNFNAGNIG